uniref:glycosyltransferase n=1 Tax=Kutzneria viridogrisea TaxID=47990 RepID=UPI00296F171D
MDAAQAPAGGQAARTRAARRPAQRRGRAGRVAGPAGDRGGQDPRRVLGESSVFLALGLYEGFGLPIAEALASGCLVLGYAAGGGQELFEAPGTWQLPDQRPTMLADAALSMVVDGLPDEDGVRAAARDWVAQRYTAQTATKALRTAVDEAMAQPGAACTAVHPMNLSDPELGAGIMRNFLRAFGMPELPVGPR